MNGSVELYFDGSVHSDPKLKTTAAGVQMPSSTYFQFDAASSNAWAIGATTGADLPASEGTDLHFHHWNNTAWKKCVTLNRDSATFAGNVSTADNKKLLLGTDNDVEIYFDNTNAYVKANAPLYFGKKSAAEYTAVFVPGGNCQLYNDNSLKFETTASGAKVNGSLEIIEPLSAVSALIKMGTSTNQNNHLKLENDGSANLRFGCFGSGATAYGNVTANDGFIHTTNDLCINAVSNNASVKIGVGAPPSPKLTIASDGNATFAGDIISSDHYLKNPDASATSLIKNSAGSNSGNIVFETNSGGTRSEALSLATDKTATFAGDIKLADTKQIIARGPANNIYGELDIKVVGADDSGSANVATFKRGTEAILLSFPSGGGINFSALDAGGNIASGDSSSSLLDDYEEGTHTTTVTVGSGHSFTVSGSSNVLTYTKIGRLVTLTGQLYGTLDASDVDKFEFTLPFPCADLTDESSVEAINISHVFRATAISGAAPSGLRSFRLNADTSTALMVSETEGVTGFGNFGVHNPHIVVNMTYFTDT
jgi:hypothetical protein